MPLTKREVVQRVLTQLLPSGMIKVNENTLVDLKDLQRIRDGRHVPAKAVDKVYEWLFEDRRPSEALEMVEANEF